MANNLASNPIYVESAATLWVSPKIASADVPGPKFVRLIQWIDDAADIVDDDDISLIINGVTFTGKIQMTNNTANNLCMWELGPFNPGICVDTFTVTTIDHGLLYIWLE